MYYIFYNNQTVIYFIEYLKSIVKTPDFKLIKIKTEKKVLKFIFKSNDNINKFIFLNNILTQLLTYTSILKNCFIINFEQLTRKSKLYHIKQFVGVINIIDYSVANINLLNNKVCYLPYQPNFKEIYNYDKINHIAMIDNLSPRRYHIVENIRKFLPIDIIGDFGLERDNKLFKYKILVNVHYADDYIIFEQLRCTRCILNKIIVITEKSLFDNYELSPYMIEVDYNNITKTVINVFTNYEKYYKRLFSNFNIDKINKIYEKNYTKFLNILNK